MSNSAWEKFCSVLGIVIALALIKGGSALFRPAASPATSRSNPGPVGTYRHGPMVLHFPGDGTVQLPFGQTEYTGTVTIKGNVATLYFPRGPKSTYYKDVPTGWDVVGYQSWTVLEASGGKYVFTLQQPQ